MSNFSTAWKAFWSILGSKDLAKSWRAIQTERAAIAQAPNETPAYAPPKGTEAVHALAILQREARLIDFIMEDISQCDDDQIGAAVRKIHDDAQETLQKYFHIQPVYSATEGDTVTIAPGFDNRAIRLAGKPAGEPPYTGTLIHKGWRSAEVTLPDSTAAVDPSVISPAEIEI